MRQLPCRPLAATLATLSLTACLNDPSWGPSLGGGDASSLTCSIPISQIQSGGVGRDAIPALSDPTLVGPEQAGAQYLRDRDRVIGIDLGGEPLAVPLNIAWWHEIVNVRVDTLVLAVTHCPLTGSSLVFDRKPLGNVEFGVSGLLFQNNLMMFDRPSGRTLWPQMARGARCGPQDGTDLTMLPSIEMTWLAWRTLHPDTRVVSSQTGFSRDYRLYPYGDYDEVDNPQLLFPVSGGIDPRRPPKERVLGIPAPDGGGLAFPFGELGGAGSVAVVEAALDGRPAVVFWDAEAESAMAFEPSLPDGTPLSFTAADGRVTDEQTDSVWGVDGRAREGPLAGERLRPVADAYVSFWFAWATFQPRAELWEQGA